MPLRACKSVLLAAAVWAGGCGAMVEPIEVAPGCPDQPLRGPTAMDGGAPGQLIDDFETANEQLTRVGGRDGYWMYGVDPVGVVFPPLDPGGTLFAPIHGPSTICPARGRFSGRFAVGSFTGWGANWTASFMAPASATEATPYDGRAWSGISFWAAFGGRNGKDFGLPVGVTTMDNAWNGKVCTTCQDFYRAVLPLTHEWRHYVIRFAELRQAGWGVPQVEALRRDQLVGFIIWPPQSQSQYDIWIDDLRFEP